MAWDQIAGVDLGEEGVGVVVRIEGEGPDLVLDRKLVDVTSDELTELLQELLQKALLGLPVRPRQRPT